MVPEVVGRYFEAWNDHDPGAIVDCFTPDGTFEDATTGGPVSGDAIAQSAAGLFGGFPDVSFDVLDIDAGADGRVWARYLMRGTNTGPLPGGPATGLVGELPGADFFVIDQASGLLAQVRGYWDMGGFLATLGLQTFVMPDDVPGLVEFGTSVRIHTGKPVLPGAFTVTSIDAAVGGPSDLQVNDVAQTMAMELGAQPGFLGQVLCSAGGRKFTFTAWKSPDDVRGLQDTSHQEAKRAYLAGELGTRLMTSVWVPQEHKGVWSSSEEGERPRREDPLQGQWL